MPLAALRNSSSSSGSRVLRVSWRESFLHVFTLLYLLLGFLLYKVAIKTNVFTSFRDACSADTDLS